MQLTQKEKDLLKDLKDQEQLCIDKYTKHSSCANDAQLKNLFSELASVERGHLETLTKIERGETVTMQGTGGGSTKSFTATYDATDSPEKTGDCYLCSDLLTTEKHASHLYDTCVFEFTDKNARDALNHIQKEEQEHGKYIYDYMSANYMY